MSKEKVTYEDVMKQIRRLRDLCNPEDKWYVLVHPSNYDTPEKRKLLFTKLFGWSEMKWWMYEMTRDIIDVRFA